MLQQTTVATVQPYYGRFVARFPDIASLAEAPEIEVLRLWAGLGYYRRARMLHQAARIIVNKYAGHLPRSSHLLRQLPGLGRYTANAIACFAFGMRVPIVEANTGRVLRRLFGHSVSAGVDSSRLWALAEGLLPARGCAEFNYALMELGSQVCKPQAPACNACPVARYCASANADDSARGERRSHVSIKRLEWHLLVAMRGGKARRVLVQRFREGEWHAGLYGFPLIGQVVASKLKEGPDSRACRCGNAQLVHIGTLRFAITTHRITADVWLTEDAGDVSSFALDVARGELEWVPLADVVFLPLASPYRRAVDLLMEYMGE
jgi:A/G-specific adenine glycosylase